MKDGGYDISDYMKIDPSFGTNEDFKELIECAKKAGIRVLMDLVVNHCSDQHEWFKQAVADPNSKYADYFIIEETDGEVPNNLRCYNGYSAWEPHRRQQSFLLPLFFQGAAGSQLGM